MIEVYPNLQEFQKCDHKPLALKPTPLVKVDLLTSHVS